MDSICDLYSGHTLLDEIYYRKYQIYNKKGEIDKAIEMLEVIVSNYPYDILKDDALFHLAQLYEIKKKDSKKAIYYYESILLECMVVFIHQNQEKI